MDFANEILILDGGLATEIERQGFSLLNDPLWSARLLFTNPQIICDVHKSFLMHGADIIITASYQASVEGFCDHLKVSPAESLELIDLSVTLAKEAKNWFVKQPEAKGRLVPLIAGSVGPFGACLCDGSEYNGHYLDKYTPETLKEWHRPRIERLVKSGVDLLAIETIPALKEAEIILDVLREYPHIKAWVSFSCRDHRYTCHGEMFSDAVKSISQSPQIAAVGINCTPPQYVTGLLDSVSDCNVPLIVYPNSGEDWGSTGWCGQKVPFTQCKDWVRLGAKIIGGCCRITPENISNIKKEILQRH